MSQRKTQIIQLTTPGIVVRFRLHPGINQFFKDRSKENSKILQKVLSDYFFQHATDEEIQKYLSPYESFPRSFQTEIAK